MRNLLLKMIVLLLANCVSTTGYTQKNDIPVSELPAEARKLTEEYVNILKIGTLDDAELNFAQLAGGDLIDEDGITLREDVKPDALKRDRSNLKFYAQPLQIVRVQMFSKKASGVGLGEIKGTLYKIWLARKDDTTGKPSYISVIVPSENSQVKTAKIVEIGRF
ncbi:MAG: hypothetical protein MUE85_08490 [Microscillaceae bacterium]|jgi:hypothetical protein|nr:hypothetical protein [Microscillaceae bacterium]